MGGLKIFGNKEALSFYLDARMFVELSRNPTDVACDVLFENTVYISGAGVLIPGRYSINPKQNTLAAIVEKAGGFAEGYSPNMKGVRKTPKGQKYLKLFIEDETAARSFILQPEDEVLTYHETEFQDATTIKITGFVRDSILVPYVDSLTLQEALV